MPKLEDIRKQLFYAEFIRDRLKKNHQWKYNQVSNALLFPIFDFSPAPSDPPEAERPFWHLGTVSLTKTNDQQPATHTNDEDSPSTPIKLLGVQIDELMRRYVGERERARDAHLNL